MSDWLEKVIKERQQKGDSLEKIKADLLKDLEEGGPIFKEFREFIKPTFENSVRRFEGTWDLKSYEWSCVMLKNSCPDCISRHKQVKTWEEWEKIGLPRTGKTQCKKECKCSLIPFYETKKEIP